MCTQRWALTAIVVFALLAPSASASLAQPAVSPAAVTPSTPWGSILFVENAGQWPDAARFQAWGSPAGVGTTWLADDAIWITIVTGSQSDELERFPEVPAGIQHAEAPPTSLALKFTFRGSNADVRIEPLDPVTTTVSYFLGRTPAQWRPAVPVWGEVRYVDLYPGVDLVLAGSGGAWTWQLLGTPKAAGLVPRLRIEGADGVTLDGVTLRLATAVGEVVLPLPAATSGYEVELVKPAGSAETIAVPPDLVANVPQSQKAPADDPGDLLYSTFLGGSSFDYGLGIAVDTAGRVFLTGYTGSSNFPTTPGAFDPTHNSYGDDAFVVRLNATGSALEYGTFLGGSSNDYGTDIAVDAAGRTYIIGYTESGNFPITTGGFDPSFNGGYHDAFVVRLNEAGSALEYATFLGGSNDEHGYGIAVDAISRAYVTGDTTSGNFPTTPGAIDLHYNGDSDAFVARLNATGSALEYGAFLGGHLRDNGYGIAVDAAGRAFVTGGTVSSNFPTTTGAFDPSHNGDLDAFVVRLNASGSALEYSTFLGSTGYDYGVGIAVDADGQAYVTGGAASNDFPTTFSAFDPSFNGGAGDAFAVELNAAGSALGYGTFLGGDDSDYGGRIAVDAAGLATVTGWTASYDFPTTPGAFDLSYNGRSSYTGDAFVTRLSATGRALQYGTYVGGSSDDCGSGIAIDAAGRAYITGETWSTNFPTTPGAFDPIYNGGPYGRDAYVSKLSLSYGPNVLASIEQPPAGAVVGGLITLSGFAIDLASAAGTGIDMVYVYLDGSSATGAFIGQATYGLNRPDMAAQYGARYGPSGWELAWDTSAAAPGMHQLYLYAHHTTDAAWSEMPPHPVEVHADHVYWLPVGMRNP